MSDTAQGHFDALLALSRTAQLARLRQQLVASITDRELVNMIQYGTSTSLPRPKLEAVALALVDVTAEAKAAGNLDTERTNEAQPMQDPTTQRNSEQSLEESSHVIPTEVAVNEPLKDCQISNKRAHTGDEMLSDL
ncbi:hypothetical protein NX059_006565 [Plenodomus lindquistii]|nr:hypothetical protein NX059_006565 [Plenodomus lindquistii]